MIAARGGAGPEAADGIAERAHGGAALELVAPSPELRELLGQRFDALVVAGSPEASAAQLRILAPACGLVVAVDRGADLCRRAQVPCHWFVGDCDTASPEGLAWAAGAEQVRLNPHKDDTDLAVALDRLPSWLPEAPRPLRVCVAGALGGRLDHLLGALGVCRAHAALALDLVDQRCWARLLSPEGRQRLALPQSGTGFSALALADGTVVSEQGCCWDLDHQALDALEDLGVSNRTVRDGAQVVCHEGALLVVREGRFL